MYDLYTKTEGVLNMRVLLIYYHQELILDSNLVSN
jgi:hypothetical protein